MRQPYTLPDDQCERLVRTELTAVRMLLAALSTAAYAQEDLHNRLECVPDGNRRLLSADRRSGRHPWPAVASGRRDGGSDSGTARKPRQAACETACPRDYRSSPVFGSMRRNSSTWIAGSARNSRSRPYLLSIS